MMSRMEPPSSHGKSGRTSAWRPSRQTARQVLALVGLSCVVGAEAIPVTSRQEILSGLGVVALVIAAVLAVIEGSGLPRAFGGKCRCTTVPASNRAWRWTLFGLACVGLLAAQTWFRSGTVIAGGDITPPIGTAWLSHLFSPLVWSGSNLGGPGQNEVQLPWAAVTWIVHLTGGSGALAQRVWLSGLLAGVLVSAAALARSLGFRPLAGIAAAFLYCFNPFTLTWVGVNGVYLVAMILLAALPAVVIAHARRRMGLWTALVAFVIAAPFVGFAYENPPLVGVLALSTLATPLLVWARFGQAAARRALRLVLVAGAVLVAASAYWIVPARAGVGVVATGRLSSLSAWAWTERRATLANALWLNTSWAWRYTAFVPYSPDFARLPLGLVRQLLPLLAFSGLACRSVTGEAGRRLTRTLGAVALPTLGVIIFSTGTLPPGNVLFDPLYFHLPGGWLLREPGRFLIFAALGYAVLVAALVERLSIVPVRRRVPTLPAKRRPISAPFLASGSMLAAVVVISLAGAFPLWTGALVPGQRQGFPSEHVKVPTYWVATTRYLNTRAPGGSLLVLPPDDFYQVPYRWYYGNDGFITNLLDRHVVDPNAQGYYTDSKELLAAVHLESSALLAHDWTEAKRVLQALETPLILVRGDIESNFPTHNIISPAALATSLARDPYMRLLYHDGPLVVYGVRAPQPQPSSFATVNTPTPDLRVLSLLPPRTALVTAPPIPGHPAILQLPPVATWHLGATALTTTVSERPGWQYSASVLGLSPGGASTQGGFKLRQVVAAGGARVMQLQVPVDQSLIRDGNFASGLWGPVGNCADFSSVHPPNVLRAAILPRAGPSGMPALQLIATIDGACEATPLLFWHGGSILLRLWVRSISGASPQLCFWESPLQRCAPTAPLPSGSNWQRYQTTVVPDPGTKTIGLSLYAYSYVPGQDSVEEYAGVVVRSLPYAPSVDVIGRPTTAPPPTQVFAYPTGYSSGWAGPRKSTHVAIDGLWNGWLTSPKALTSRDVRFLPVANEQRDEILLAAAMLLLATGILLILRRWPAVPRVRPEARSLEAATNAEEKLHD